MDQQGEMFLKQQQSILEIEEDLSRAVDHLSDAIEHATGERPKPFTIIRNEHDGDDISEKRA